LGQAGTAALEVTLINSAATLKQNVWFWYLIGQC
jgi:hypothetical protein